MEVYYITLHYITLYYIYYIFPINYIGKGTQCEFIKKEYGVVHLSTGDMLRAAVESGSDLGKEANNFMNSGKLVPDALIIGVVVERLKERDCVEQGWLLDGFPRSRGQADALFDAGIECDIFLQLDVDDSLLVERVVGRRMDPLTGKIYHLKFSPPPDDPELKARLQQRSDDTEEKSTHRLRSYNQNLKSITDKYKGKIVRFNGNRAPGAVWAEMRSLIPRSFKYEVVFVLGGPGCGKRTLCQTLSQATDYMYLSAGDLLRDELKTGSEVASIIRNHQVMGTIVPAEITVGLFAKAMKAAHNMPGKKQNKFLIDGFPQNSVNLTAWYQLMSSQAIVDMVLNLDCPEETMKERIRIRSQTSGREDENDATIFRRLEAFIRETQPVLQTFDRLGRLRTIDASVTPELVLKQAKRCMDSIRVLPPYHRTFAIIKPDAVAGGNIAAIQQAIIDANLNIISSKLVSLEDATVEGFYAEHLEKSFFPNLKAFMTSGPAVAMVLEGVDAVAAWRQLMGPTNTAVAQAEAPSSLRAKYGSDGTRNAVHGSDSELSASREIDFFFNPSGPGYKVSLASSENSSSALGSTIGGLPNQETFVMIKPIASILHYDSIMSIIVGQGFEILSELRTKLSKAAAGRFYAEHKGKQFFDTLIDYMTSGDIIAMHLKRPAAVSSWRYLIGPTNKAKADLERPRNCIRSLFAIDGTKNAVHGSDATISATREINFFFPFQSDASPPSSSIMPIPPVTKTPISSPQKGFVSPSKSSPERKVHNLPSLSMNDAQLMKQYSIQEMSPIMMPLCEKLMINRPKNVAEFARAELNRMLSAKLDGDIEPTATDGGGGWDDLSIASDEAVQGGGGLV